MHRLFLKNRRTERGASITFALLLFLVCAVIGSVVLTAGTAASGRISALGEADQRYYCVTSAVSLLRSCLDGQPADAVQTETFTVTRSVSYVGGTATPSAPTEGAHTVSAVAYSSSGKLASLLEGAAEQLMTSDASEGELTQLQSRSLTVTVGSGTQQLSALEAQVAQTLFSDGTMVLSVSNRQGEPYTLRMIFTPERSEKTERQETAGTPTVTYTDDGYTVTRVNTTVVTTTTTFRWTLSEIGKGAGA